jgi:hypothetical protein
MFYQMRKGKVVPKEEPLSSNRDVHLWAHTSIPIDHSIRVYLRIDDESITVEDVAIEG